jgi:hypothetical protein
MQYRNLIIEFEGYCMLRQPTDPEPYDENRGTSGYTFAFGNEPDLNRIIYFQPDPEFPMRSHCPPLGVHVSRAYIEEVGSKTDVDVLAGAKFNLLGDPKLENRNWALTRPGYEPIIPFHIEIAATDNALVLNRLDVLDPEHPDKPVWKLPLSTIESKGARGLAYEPATVGAATGTYNGYVIARQRRALLQKDLDSLPDPRPADDPEKVVLQGRISELDIGIRAFESGHPDRRTSVRPIIERFGYVVTGKPGTLKGDPGPLRGEIDLSADSQWRIDFWMGGWDADALCCYTKGTLQIPYVTDSKLKPTEDPIP